MSEQAPGICTSQFTYRDLKKLEQASPSSPLRVVALIDLDAFYAQCEIARLGLSPNTPLAVQQWNAIIALNYPARQRGLKRGMEVDEVRKLCPEIVLQHVATRREGELGWAYRSDVREKMATDKSALDPYRQKSRQIFEFVCTLLPAVGVQGVEKASIDEIFLDLSTQVYQALIRAYPEISSSPSDMDSALPKPLCTMSIGNPEGDPFHDNTAADRGDRLDWDDVVLQLGADIVRHIREEVKAKFQCTCSAGIARNKMLAKLGSGYRKPDQQSTILNANSARFLALHKLTEIRGLGGKLGHSVVELLGSDQIVDVLQVPLPMMRLKLGDEHGSWVYNVIRGHDLSPITPRIDVKSMISAKTFAPKISGMAQAERWLMVFIADLVARMNDANEEATPNRPKTIILSHFIDGRFGPRRSKQTKISPGTMIDEHSLLILCLELLRQICEEGQTWPCRSLSVTVSDFSPVPRKTERITSFFPRANDDHDGMLSARFRLALSNKSAIQNGILDSGAFVSAERDTCPETSFDMQSVTDLGRAGDPGTISVPLAQTEELLGDHYRCPHCKMIIEEQRVLEHLDWHFATNLAAE